MPTGVKYVSQLLILDSGATAGTFRFSNASAWASNLLDLGLVKDLREMVDAIGGTVNSEAANIEARLQAITADGKITASEIVGLIQQAQVSGLAIMQTVINQILDILNGNIVTPINSLVQGVKDWFGLNQNKTQKLTSGGGLSTADVVGTFDMSRVDDLVDNLGNILSGVKDGADGVGTGTTGAIGDRINQAKDSLLALLSLSQDALKSAIAAQTTLQEQETEQNTGDGNSYSFVFSGADGAALNATDWTTGPTPGDITIRGDSGYAGVKNGNPDGYFFASPNYTYATDGQSASFVLGNTQNGNYYSGVFIRCNADRTTGAYCLAKEGEVRVGKFTRSGTSWTFATPMTFQGGLSSVKQGARIEIRCSGNNFFVRVNGKPVTSATDVSGTIAAGPDYRYAMFIEQRATSWFTYDSYRIAAFAMSDYSPSGGSATLSNAWSLTRSSTSGFTYTDPITSAGLLPASFFTFTDYANGATITDLGRGAVTVDQAGLYKLATTCRPYSAKGPVTPHWCLYRNDVQVTGAIGPGAEFEILLNAGDKIQPALIVVDYDVRSNGSTGSETVVSRTITQVFGVASFTGRKLI
ncbi:bacteriophage membrane protein [Mycobacteroides abscessus subsp. massiliense]|nr:bacteriophage membrane protein [Mycobacteroides abscessus subsp. massiliense]